jgi:hypothetical protein
MNTNSQFPSDSKENVEPVSTSNDALEEDGTPVLDENDLEENELTVEEADQIVWDEPTKSKGSSGNEEKDITD